MTKGYDKYVIVILMEIRLISNVGVKERRVRTYLDSRHIS